eukprot:39226-Heterocapsa_arctica.AAC.1
MEEGVKGKHLWGPMDWLGRCPPELSGPPRFKWSKNCRVECMRCGSKTFRKNLNEWLANPCHRHAED